MWNASRSWSLREAKDRAGGACKLASRWLGV